MPTQERDKSRKRYNKDVLMLRTRTRITLRRRADRLMITVTDTILTDKVILHTTRQEILLLAIKQF